MTVLFFGTYDKHRHPRVNVLIQGFKKHGDHVVECNVPLGDTTHERVAVLRRPWRLSMTGVRIAKAWAKLVWLARSMPKPDVVVVGYLAQLDIHLARRLWPRALLAIDYLVSLDDTAADRRSGNAWVRKLLRRLDDAALRTADRVVVDTIEHATVLVPGAFRHHVTVVAVGAAEQWFSAPRRRSEHRLRVVFFGLFTPLQGTETIGKAVQLLAGEPIDFVMIGTGQDYESVRATAYRNENVTWLDWVDGKDLPGVVASNDVCLGIFGTTPKAMRVVPNKVFQGAAAGCAIVTSDTPPQRRTLQSCGVLIRPGSAEDLAAALTRLAHDPDAVWAARNTCYSLARAHYRPSAVVSEVRHDWATTLIGQRGSLV